MSFMSEFLYVRWSLLHGRTFVSCLVFQHVSTALASVAFLVIRFASSGGQNENFSTLYLPFLTGFDDVDGVEIDLYRVRNRCSASHDLQDMLPEAV